MKTIVVGYDETEPSKRVFGEVGDLLFAVVSLARKLRVDPEDALRVAGQRFRDRFAAWLTHEGAATHSIPEFLDGLCCFLNGEGYAIYRANLATEAIHPLIANTRHVWFPEWTDPGPVNPAVVIARRQFRIGDVVLREPIE